MRRTVMAGLLIVFAAAASAVAFHDAVPSFERVTDRVYVGGQPTADDLALLCGIGVRTVIDLREDAEHDVDAERLAAERLGMVFLHVPVRPDAPRDGAADAFLAATARESAFPIFVHCASGNRAAAFWMIHRLVVDGWTVAAAEGEARRVGLRSAILRDFAIEYARRRAPQADDESEEIEP